MSQKLLEKVHSLVTAALDTENVSRSELAKRLETSTANLTQLLSLNRNLTLKSLSKIAGALGYEVEVILKEGKPEVTTAFEETSDESQEQSTSE